MKASTHQCWLAIILPKAYENSTQIWGDYGAPNGHRIPTRGFPLDEEVRTVAQRFVLMGSNLIRRLATPDSLLPNPPIVDCRGCYKAQQQDITCEPQNGIVASRRKHSLKHDKSQHLLTCRCSLLSFTTLVLEKGNLFNNIVIPLLEQYYYSRIHVIVNNSSSIPIHHLSKSRWPEEKANLPAGRQERRRQQARHRNRTAQRLAYRYVTTVRVDVFLVYISSAESAQVIPRVGDRN